MQEVLIGVDGAVTGRPVTITTRRPGSAPYEHRRHSPVEAGDLNHARSAPFAGPFFTLIRQPEHLEPPQVLTLPKVANPKIELPGPGMPRL